MQCILLQMINTRRQLSLSARQAPATTSEPGKTCDVDMSNNCCTSHHHRICNTLAVTSTKNTRSQEYITAPEDKLFRILYFVPWSIVKLLKTKQTIHQTAARKSADTTGPHSGHNIQVSPSRRT